MKPAQLSPQQHAVRDKGIGSSDAASAVGLNPYKTRMQLWLEKTGREPRPDLSDVEAVHFGNVLEDVVAHEYMRRNNKKVQRRNVPYVKDFMVANIDRLVAGENRILEIKTASAFQKWDEVPDHYRIQVEHQFICADKSEGVLAVLIGGNQYQQFELRQDPDLSQFLIAREREFWECVKTDTPPQPTKAEEVVQLYRHDNGEAKIATPELAELHAELLAVRKSKKDAEEREKALKESFQLFMGESAQVLLSEGGNPLVTWKTDKGTERTDWKSAFHELAAMTETDPVLFVSNHTRKHFTRRFLVKEPK